MYLRLIINAKPTAYKMCIIMYVCMPYMHMYMPTSMQKCDIGNLSRNT